MNRTTQYRGFSDNLFVNLECDAIDSHSPLIPKGHRLIRQILVMTCHVLVQIRYVLLLLYLLYI